MFSAKRRVWLLSGAVALATIFMLPVSAASASTVRPVLAASVTYVDTIGGQFFSQTTVELYKLHIEIYGPGGTIKNCGTFNLKPLGSAMSACGPIRTRTFM